MLSNLSSGSVVSCRLGWWRWRQLRCKDGASSQPLNLSRAGERLRICKSLYVYLQPTSMQRCLLEKGRVTVLFMVNRTSTVHANTNTIHRAAYAKCTSPLLRTSGRPSYLIVTGHPHHLSLGLRPLSVHHQVGPPMLRGYIDAGLHSHRAPSSEKRETVGSVYSPH